MISGTGPITSLRYGELCLGLGVGTLASAVARLNIDTVRLGATHFVTRESLEEYFTCVQQKKRPGYPDWSRASVWVEYDGFLRDTGEAAEYLQIGTWALKKAVTYLLIDSVLLANTRLLKEEALDEYRERCLVSGPDRRARSYNSKAVYRHVSWKSRLGKYEVRLWAAGRNRHVGYFDDAEIAHERQLLAERVGLEEYDRLYPPKHPRRAQY